LYSDTDFKSVNSGGNMEKLPEKCPICKTKWSSRQSPFSLNVWVYCSSCDISAKDILDNVKVAPEEEDIGTWSLERLSDEEFIRRTRNLWGID
jgi:ribosomal protein L37AE/L43A